MATFRVGVGSFNINDGSVGIGTEGSGHGNLKVEGTLKVSTNLDVLGVSTFTRYSGFSADEVNINNRDLTLSGEYATTGDIVVENGASLTVGLGSTVCAGAIECISVKKHFSVPSGDTPQRNETSGYAEGTVRYNVDFGTMEFFNGNEWRQFTYISDIQNSPSSRGRGVVAKGKTSEETGQTKKMDYVNITSQGNSINFGDLTVARFFFSGGNASSTRGIFGGGDPGPSNSDVIDYITIASEGNAIDFGNLLAAGRCFAGASSSTRGLHFGDGSSQSGTQTNVISYSQIQTLGNALDFGDLTSQNSSKGTAASSPTRYVFHTQNNSLATIDFGKIASKGNSARFGDYISGGPSHGAAALLRCCSNQTRAVFAGGYLLISPYGFVTSKMGAITIASEGNAIVFGDLTVARYGVSATSNQVRGVFAGGQGGNPYPYISTIDFITFASSGNAQDFGDMDASVGGAVSDSHGGLGGY